MTWRTEQVREAIRRALAPLGDLPALRPGPPYVPGDYMFDGGYPYHWIDGEVLHYEFRERARVLMDRTTRDLDELVGWVVSDVARELAMAEERGHRRPGEDRRRRWFAEWVRLATLSAPRYGERVQAEIDEILAQSPFRDP